MDEQVVLYTAGVISILGLILLVYSSELLQPPQVSIGDIDRSFLEKNVLIEGKITSVKVFKGGSKLLVLKDATGSINVYLPPALANKTIAKNTTIRIIGTVHLYKNELEIVPSSIEQI